MSLSSYRELRVWREAMQLTKDIYALTKEFPPEERYGLTAQLRRGAVTVPSTIAEGYARYSLRDYLRYVSMARGAVAEMETQLILASELGMAKSDELLAALARGASVGRMLNRLATSLSHRQRRPTP